MSFVHLRVHDIYSFSEGIGSPSDFAKRAKSLNQTSLAMTNVGNLCGAYSFWKACHEVSIKPILGQEFFIAESDDMRSKDSDKQRRLILLANSQDGWRNLQYLSTMSYTDGFYCKPRIDSGIISKHKSGLIAISGGVDGICGTHWLMGEEKKAIAIVQRYQRIFGDNFWLEVIPAYHQQQISYNQFVVQIAKMLKCNIVATNNCYYPTEEKAKYHPYLLMIKMAMKSDDFARKGPIINDLYLKSREEMMDGFISQGFDEDMVMEWLNNTIEIAKQVEEIQFEKSFKLPRYSDFENVKKSRTEKDDESSSGPADLFEQAESGQ